MQHITNDWFLLRAKMHRKLLRYCLALTTPEVIRRRECSKIAFLLFLLTFATFIVRILCNGVHFSYHRPEMLRILRETPLCELPSDLGPISVNRTNLDLEELDDSAFPELKWGGQFSPDNCIAIHKVAIIVPYRDRKEQLPIFLNHMHDFLMKQQIEYGIFIVEQASRSFYLRNDYFNRGKLLNVGFLESQNASDWQCFVFHDIDLLPLDQRNIYSCPDKMHPRHHAAAIDRQSFRLPYKTMFDGVSAMTLRQFTDVNGFSNTFWGADGENDDIVLRMHSKGYSISRYNMTIARYASLHHKPNPWNKNQHYQWHQFMLQARNTLQEDGLTTLKYTVKSVVPHRLYTHIKAEIGRSPTYDQLLKIMKRFNLQQDVGQSDLDQIKKELTAIL